MRELGIQASKSPEFLNLAFMHIITESESIHMIMTIGGSGVIRNRSHWVAMAAKRNLISGLIMHI